MTPIRLRVEELRKAKGLSQVELANRAGIQRGTIIAIEKGRTRGIDFDTLDRVAAALGVDAAMLVVHTKRGER